MMKYFQDLTLRKVIFIALILRLIAVVFAKGFGMHDDHFVIIEAAQSWADGTDYNNWLPKNGAKEPGGHSFLYVGIHYIIFECFNWLKVINPQWKMFLIRLFHALYSLIVVYCGYKITERFSSKKLAGMVGLILAAFWPLPWLSVRNLPEMACIPPLIAGSWIYLKNSNKENLKNNAGKILLAGLLLGLSVSVRFHTILYVMGFGTALLILRKWKDAFLIGIGSAATIIATQGIIDYFIWGRPFAEFIAYLEYNAANATNYINNPWYTYLLLFGGILIPPISLLMYFGFFRSYKIHLPIFIGTLLFFAFHSYFPNKQERFILPILPFFIILGVVGFEQFREKSKYWANHPKLLRGFWIAFWVLNLTLLPIVTTMYGKKARVESMSYLRKYPNIQYIMLEDVAHQTPKMVPEFYLGQWIGSYDLCKEIPLDTMRAHLKNINPIYYPRFVLFFDDKNLQSRVDSVKTILPGIVYETTIEPGLVDKIMYRLNPRNVNQTIYIFRNTQFFPKPL